MPETLVRRFELHAEPRGQTYVASLSSEQPVERDFGVEVLEHTAEAVDLSRARDGLPLLFNHDTQRLIGRVSGLHVAERRLRGSLAFFDTTEGRQALVAVENGHREVSVRYEILKTRSERDGVVRVTRWKPYEASVVSVPADATVGIGRAAPSPHAAHTAHTEHSMQDDIPQDPPLQQSRSQRRAAQASAAALAATEQSAVEAERERIKTIRLICRQQKVGDEFADRAIAEGVSIDDFCPALLEHVEARRKANAVFVPIPSSFGASDISVQSREWAHMVNRFSIGRLMQARLDPATFLRHAGPEMEVSQELARGAALPSNGVFVPIEAFFGSVIRAHQRSLSVAVAAAGGNTVQTTIDPSLFADALRTRTIAGALGARLLPGLSSTLVIPRKTATTAAGWLTETGAAASSDPAFDQLTLAPKRIGAYTDVSRQLILQSELAMEELVQADLTQTILVELDRVALLGTGASNQPRGITNTAGVGSVVGGTNGAQINWGHVLDLERAVADANAQVDLGACGYAINPKSRGWMKRTQKVAASSAELILGDDAMDASGITRLNGYRCGVSTQLPSNGTKGTSSGVCSTLIYGCWSELFIGIFGPAVEVIVDPYTLATTAQVRVTANLFADIGVRRAASFAVMSDALTV